MHGWPKTIGRQVCFMYDTLHVYIHACWIQVVRYALCTTHYMYTYMHVEYRSSGMLYVPHTTCIHTCILNTGLNVGWDKCIFKWISSSSCSAGNHLLPIRASLFSSFSIIQVYKTYFQEVVWGMWQNKCWFLHTFNVLIKFFSNFHSNFCPWKKCYVHTFWKGRESIKMYIFFFTIWHCGIDYQNYLQTSQDHMTCIIYKVEFLRIVFWYMDTLLLGHVIWVSTCKNITVTCASNISF